MPRTIGSKFPIIVTSYEVALSDSKKFLRHYSWKYLVIDEVSDLTNLSADQILLSVTC
jgi:ATP-dependent DNA helicase